VSAVLPTRVSRFQGASLKPTVPVLSPVILLCVWELSARAHLVDTRFFPEPTGILLVLGEMLQSGELVAHIGVSLQRIAVGLFIGAVPGMLIGIAVGLVPILRAVIQPLIDITFPIPMIYSLYCWDRLWQSTRWQRLAKAFLACGIVFHVGLAIYNLPRVSLYPVRSTVQSAIDQKNYHVLGERRPNTLY